MLELLDPDENVPDNFGGISVEGISHAGGCRTSRFSLDSFLSVPHLRFMKIDVEGMELDVLRGAESLLTKFGPVLYVENDRPAKSAALIQFLLAFA